MMERQQILATMGELKRWNDQYGEGGSRQKEQLAYYT